MGCPGASFSQAFFGWLTSGVPRPFAIEWYSMMFAICDDFNASNSTKRELLTAKAAKQYRNRLLRAYLGRSHRTISAQLGRMCWKWTLQPTCLNCQWAHKGLQMLSKFCARESGKGALCAHPTCGPFALLRRKHPLHMLQKESKLTL